MHACVCTDTHTQKKYIHMPHQSEHMDVLRPACNHTKAKGKYRLHTVFLSKRRALGSR